VNTVTQILDSIAEEAARADRTDGQLLDLFVRLRDEAAFAAVVRRHGPMVLGVCRRVLRNAADADDAFQAAFLVLARKASTITTRHLLAQWLYGVAYNTARKLRQSNARRALREGPLAGAEPLASAPDARDELLVILDEELNQLPDRYRAVLVLCDLEGAAVPKGPSAGAWRGRGPCSPNGSRGAGSCRPRGCSARCSPIAPRPHFRPRCWQARCGQWVLTILLVPRRGG
jgi:RNA polymerase sigma factor (sigma-70 family)